MLGLRDVRFLRPVFGGDTIYAECEVVGTKSAGRVDSGIVTLRTRGYNQRGERLVEFVRDFMVRRRGGRVGWGERRSRKS